MKKQFKKINADLYSREASFEPSTLDEKKRTVEMIWSTGAKVKRAPFFDDPYNEELSLDPKHVRLDRLNAGGPLLESHNSGSLSNILGIVRKAWTENGVGKAIVEFSERAEVEPIFQDVKKGIIRNVSVGYRVYKMEDVSQNDDKIKTFRAIDWEPHEVSLVAIPADAGSSVRSENRETNDCELEIRENDITENLKGGVTRMDPKELESKLAEAKLLGDKETEEKLNAIKARNSDIISTCRSAKLDSDLAIEHIEKGTTAEEFRKLVIEKLANKTEEKTITSAQKASVGEDLSRAASKDGMENALLSRSNPSAFTVSEKGQEFRSMSLLDMAKESLEISGVKTRRMSNMEVAKLALTRTSGMHGTTDFPLILENVLGKVLRAGYEMAGRTFLPFVKKAELADFKEVSRVQLGNAPKLKKVNENGEYEFGSMSEAAEKYKLATYGKIVSVTRQMIINDDLNAFTDLAQMFGQSAADLESDIVYGILNANAAMSDSVALFHATHNNLGTAGVPSVTTLAELRKLARLQKGLGTTAEQQYINVLLKYLVVSPDHETAAEQLLTSILANQTSNVNPFQNKLELIVEPRLEVSGTNPWYAIANPAQVQTIEVAYLRGQEGVFIETEETFKVDGMSVKARHDFAAKAIDWRGMYKNAGA